MIVRWAPADYESWKWGNEHGYTLARINNDSESAEDRYAKLGYGLKPLPEEEWESLVSYSDMAKVAFEMIFRDSLEGSYLENADFMTVYEAQRARENLRVFCLMAADRELDVAIASGLAFVDNSFSGEEEYQYYVSFDQAPDSTEVKNGICTVGTKYSHQLPTPAGLSAQGGDHSAIIRWETMPEYYGSYWIERSGDGGATWEQVNSSPLLVSGEEEEGYIYYRDSLAANDTLFVYRVEGCSPFGIVGPESDTVHVYGRPGPLADGYADYLTVEELTAGELTLGWEFPDSLETEIQGFDIYRAKEQEGNYEKINATRLAATARSFADDEPLPANYYKVTVVDDNGYELSSVPKLGQPTDSIPPSPPASLTGSCNRSGVATLTWSRSSEPDVMGYRVFLSNMQEGDFVQITTTWINDTVYHYGLNLNTLSEEVYFVVKAVDFRENMSQPSSVCLVQRPDIIPPAAPSITSVRSEPGKVHFEWALSSSEDVVDYEFQRKPNGAPGWVTLLAFDHDPQQNPPLAFTDSTASVRRYWDYRLLARDDAGLLGSSNVIKAKPLDTGLRDSITNFTGQLIDNGNVAILEWDYIKDDPDLAGFQIYRSFDTCAMQSYRFITVEEALDNVLTTGSNALFAFVDYDLDFRVPVQTAYVTNVDVNTVVTGGTVAVIGTSVSVTPQSPNLPQNPQDGVIINYWVMARYIDGGYSALSEGVELEQ
ncbi:MAG: fibronectin type III domain-containing protein [Saprospirales bacterium]|nr:fibronectin type III domain-containing protein [Saprospirales bacterium]